MSYLRDRRLEVGLTQKQVAEAVGVSESAVSRWESGDIGNMRRDRIAKYAKILRVSPIFIMTGKHPAEPDSGAVVIGLDVGDAFDKLSDENKLKVRDYIMVLLTSQEYQKAMNGDK